MNEKEIRQLENANLSEDKFDYCYITEDGLIFTPLYDVNTGTMIKTGKQVYDEWVKNRDVTTE